jgi:hypothetical protein
MEEAKIINLIPMQISIKDPHLYVLTRLITTITMVILKLTPSLTTWWEKTILPSIHKATTCKEKIT